MTDYFPVTKPISNAAETIIVAMNSRSYQLKSSIDSQGLFKKITMMALKALGLAGGVIAVASPAVAALMFAVTPLIIGGITLVIAISCLALSVLMDPRSPAELRVKDLWSSLFEALRKGNGKKILEACKELSAQKEMRPLGFTQCLGTLSLEETAPFFHKTWLLGHLQVALEHLRNNDPIETRSSAHMALSHFDASGFSQEIKDFVQCIADSPVDMQEFMATHPVRSDLHGLDYLVVMKSQGLTG